MNISTVAAAPLSALTNLIVKALTPGTALAKFRSRAVKLADQIDAEATAAAVRADALYEGAARVANMAGDNLRYSVSARGLANKIRSVS